MSLPQPVWEEVGPASGPTAVVMAPMMAAWDHGAFCGPLTELLLVRGFHITVYDTMSLARHCADLPEAALRWSEILASRHSRIDLAVGQAYGGALLQYLLDGVLAKCPRFLGISAPTYCDDALRAGLGDVLRQLRDCGPEAALQSLEWRVLAEGSVVVPPVPEQAPAETVARLTPGLSHLCAADARRSVAAYRGRALWLCGDASRLVRAGNIAPAPHYAGQRVASLPGCGMRPLNDARDTALALIEDFLD